MENFRLKVFRTVADNLNFRQAAEALYLTQPAVTLQIKALEEDLGVPLFDRTENTAALTEAGRILLKHTKMAEALTAGARPRHSPPRLASQAEPDPCGRTERNTRGAAARSWAPLRRGGGTRDIRL